MPHITNIELGLVDGVYLENHYNYVLFKRNEENEFVTDSRHASENNSALPQGVKFCSKCRQRLLRMNATFCPCEFPEWFLNFVFPGSKTSLCVMKKRERLILFLAEYNPRQIFGDNSSWGSMHWYILHRGLSRFVEEKYIVSSTKKFGWLASFLMGFGIYININVHTKTRKISRRSLYRRFVVETKKETEIYLTFNRVNSLKSIIVSKYVSHIISYLTRYAAHKHLSDDEKDSLYRPIFILLSKYQNTSWGGLRCIIDSLRDAAFSFKNDTKNIDFNNNYRFVMNCLEEYIDKNYS